MVGRRFARYIIAFLALAGCLAGLIAWLSVAPRSFFSFLVFTYTVAGLISASAYLVATVWPNWTRDRMLAPGLGQIQVLLMQSVSQTIPQARVRKPVLAVLNFAERISNWPIPEYISVKMGIGRRKDLDVMAYLEHLRLRNFFVVQSIFSLVFAVFCSIAISFLDRFASSLLIGLAVNGISTRHLSYACTYPPLPTLLRRTLWNPVVAFFFILAIDFISLLIVLNSAFSHYGGMNTLIERTRLMLTDMFTLRELFNIIFSAVRGEQEIDFARLLVCGIGAVYYFFLLRHLFRPFDFVRQDEDRVSVSMALSTSGRFNRGLDWLQGVKNESAQTAVARLTAYLGLNQVDRAWEIALSAAPGRDRQEALRIMIEPILLGRVPIHVVPAVWERALREDVSDALTCIFAQVLIQTRSNALLRILDEVDEERLARERPLTYAIFGILTEDVDNSILILRNATPGDDVEELLRLWLLLLVQLCQQERPSRDVYESWMAERWEDVRAIVVGLESYWKRRIAIDVLHNLLAVDTVAGSVRSEEILFFLRGLTDGMRERHELIALKAAELRANQLGTLLKQLQHAP